jgi:hypothetical protein
MALVRSSAERACRAASASSPAVWASRARWASTGPSLIVALLEPEDPDQLLGDDLVVIPRAYWRGVRPAGDRARAAVHYRGRICQAAWRSNYGQLRRRPSTLSSSCPPRVRASSMATAAHRSSSCRRDPAHRDYWGSCAHATRSASTFSIVLVRAGLSRCTDARSTPMWITSPHERVTRSAASQTDTSQNALSRTCGSWWDPLDVVR